MPEHIDDLLDRCRHGMTAGDYCDVCDALVDLSSEIDVTDEQASARHERAG